MQLDLLLDRVGQPEEHRVQGSGGLTGSHHGHVETVERLRVAIERDRERRPSLHVEADLAEDPAELGVLGLFGQDRQRPQDRQPGVDHRRELARQNGDVLQRDSVRQSWDLDVGGELGLGTLIDRDGRVTHLTELVDHELRAVGLEPAFEHLPTGVANLVDKR